MSFRRTIPLVEVLATLLLITHLAVRVLGQTPPPDARPLLIDHTTERQITGGNINLYTVELKRGFFLSLEFNVTKWPR